MCVPYSPDFRSLVQEGSSKGHHRLHLTEQPCRVKKHRLWSGREVPQGCEAGCRDLSDHVREVRRPLDRELHRTATLPLPHDALLIQRELQPASSLDLSSLGYSP